VKRIIDPVGLVKGLAAVMAAQERGIVSKVTVRDSTADTSPSLSLNGTAEKTFEGISEIQSISA